MRVTADYIMNAKMFRVLFAEGFSMEDLFHFLNWLYQKFLKKIFGHTFLALSCHLYL